MNWFLKTKNILTRLLTLENDKVKPAATGVVLFAAGFLDWSAGEATRIYGDAIPYSQPGFGFLF